jgi:outer membrane protein assembly factor BamD (BamD/ComL family)
MYIVLMNANIGAHRYADAVAAIDTFLKLSATGPQADQVRRLKEQVVAAMQKQQAQQAAAPATPSPSTGAASPAPH